MSTLDDLEKAAQAATSGFVAKQEGWIMSHALPLIIGFAAGIALSLIAHYL